MREGLLRRQRGRGTFIVEPCPDAGIDRAGHRAADATDVEIVDVSLRHPSPDTAALLGLDPASPMLEIVQQRSAQGRVIALERIVLDGQALPLGGLVELAGDNLYALLSHYGSRQ